MYRVSGIGYRVSGIGFRFYPGGVPQPHVRGGGDIVHLHLSCGLGLRGRVHVQGFRFRVADFSFRISVFAFRVSGQDLGTGFMAQGGRFRGSGFWIGFQVSGSSSGFELRLRVS